MTEPGVTFQAKYTAGLTIIFAAVVFSFVIFGRATDCWCRFGFTRMHLEHIAESADLYHAEHGDWPVTDNDSSWFEKLCYENYLTFEMFVDRFGVTDAPPVVPVDVNNVPYVYLPPDDGSETAIVRSVGANGIDENGAGDDWDVRMAPSVGSWYKINWFDGYIAAIALFLPAVLLMRWVVTGRDVGSAQSVVLIAAFYLTIPAVLSGPHRAGQMWYHLPPTLQFMSTVGLLLFFVGLVVLTPLRILGAGLRSIRHARHHHRISRSCCEQCNYDLRGNTSGVCPECGTQVRFPVMNENADSFESKRDRVESHFTNFVGPPF